MRTASSPTPGSARGRPRLPSGAADRLAFLLRWVIPATAVLAGAVAMCFGTDTSLEGGAGLIGAGLAIVLFDRMFRLGAESDADREREERARDFYSRKGHWPSRRELDEPRGERRTQEAPSTISGRTRSPGTHG